MNKTTIAETRRLMANLKEMQERAEKLKEVIMLSLPEETVDDYYYTAAELSELTGLTPQMIANHLNHYTKASKEMKDKYRILYSSKPTFQTYVKLNEDGTVDFNHQMTVMHRTNTYRFERKEKNRG